MKIFPAKLSFVLALALATTAFVACGDDDNDSTNNANDGGNTQMDATNNAQMDATNNMQMDATNNMQMDATNGGGNDVYTGAPDQCVGLTFDSSKAAADAASSGASCLGGNAGDAEGFRNCVRDAVIAGQVVGEGEDAITEGCGYCYGVSVQCTTLDAGCTATCLAGSDSPACISCRLA